MPAPGPDWAVSPLSWGAMINYDLWDDPYTPDDGIAVHHGGASNYPAHNQPFDEQKEVDQLRSWEAFHVAGRGWRGIAYGWAVGQTGTVYRLRGWNRYGAHPGDIDDDGVSNNDEIIPVLFIGSGYHAGFSPAAEESLVRLREYLEEESGQALRLYGHKEVKTVGATSCPGPKIMDYVETHRMLEEEDDMADVKIPRPSWVSDAMLERLAEQNIVPRELETEDLWRSITFLDRHDTARPHSGGDCDCGDVVKRGDTVTVS